MIQASDAVFAALPLWAALGTVLLHSRPFSHMAERILQHAPAAGGSAKGEGSVLGGIGRLLDGN